MPGPGEHVACPCPSTGGFLVHMCSTDVHDDPALATVHTGAAANHVHIGWAAQRRLGVIRTSARGGRVDAKRAGEAFKGGRLPGRLADRCQHRGEHLQATQLSGPGQQICDQQHAQPGDA